jgi:cyclophilin family peptidyl-prolyl cis-trans isomerase
VILAKQIWWRPIATLCGAISIATIGCAGNRMNPGLRGRDLLFDPSNAFWREEAPHVFRARVETTRGTFVMEIHRAWAPVGADRFYNLIRAGYYDDSRFTRVVPGFIAQFGIARDSAINATWSSRAIADDSVKQSNVRGAFGYAMTGPNARTTQIYINLVDNTRLDAQGFSPLGRVVEGMSVVDSLYGGYGETSGGGVRAGNQGPLRNGGNAYVDRMYPKLDRLIWIRVDGWTGGRVDGSPQNDGR